jgi:hypothetical protein
LETEIMGKFIQLYLERGDIVDLLISFAYSAAVSNQNTNFDSVKYN